MDSTTVDRQAADRSVEHLVHEINEVIDHARPDERAELRQMASDLIRQEAVDTGYDAHIDGNHTGATKRPLSLIAFGGIVLILGAGLSFIIPPVGLVLVGGGLATIVVGALYQLVSS
jgi:hypothetical protein